MKRLITTITIVASIGISSMYAAFTPTTEQKQDTQTIITQIDNIIDGDRPLQYAVIRKLKTMIQDHNNPNSAKHYLRNSVYNHLHTDFQNAKNAKKNIIKNNYKSFLQAHEAKNTTTRGLPAQCYTYINDLDDLAFAHNISLPVLIATRYREFTCGYSRPGNGRGPMQIISKNYGSGPFASHEDFIQAMEDYIEFANGKYNRYNRYNRRRTGMKMNLTYTNTTYDDVVKHGALYNGLANRSLLGSIQPHHPDYVFDQFNEEYKNALRPGIMSAVTKMMRRRVTNK